MFDDENEPRLRSAAPRKLDGMSLHELKAYIAEMQAEISRAEGEIRKKEAHQDAAKAFFKTEPRERQEG